MRVRRALAALTIAALLSGCWGYTKASKRGAYVLDSTMILGGGGLITLGVLDPPQDCDMTMPNAGCNDPVAGPVGAAMVIGSMLVVGGLVAFIVNATRPIQRTSR